MACCTIENLSGYKRGCKSVGGVSKVYLIDKCLREQSDITYDTTSVPGAVAIASTVGGVSAYEIIPNQNSWNLTQPVTDDNNTGTSFVTQTLGGNLRGYSAALAAMADNIRKGRLEVLVEFRNGTYAFCGIESNGLQSNGGDQGFSGVAIGDEVGFSFVLTQESEFTAPIVATFTEFEAAFTIVVAA